MAIVAGSASGAWAADMKPILKAAPPELGWYFTGKLDVGVRTYIERPPSGFGYDPAGDFLLPTQTDSRAKFEEYRDIPPGLFLDWIYLEAGSNNGVYNVDVWGKDVAEDDQRFGFDFAQNGFQYLTLGWDQTPHLYSTSAKSLFSGVGTTDLTVSNNVQALLQPLWANAGNSNAAGLAARQAINNIVNTNATHIDEIGTRRDTFSFGYRITPTPEWDFKVAYAHQDRTGTKPGTLNYNAGTSFPSNVIAVPVPVDDTTQTPKASGEYAGAGPWGRYSFQMAYLGSIYTDNLTQLNVENPFGQTGGVINFGPGTLRAPLPPSNQAHSFTASGATQLPVFNSRFTTVNQFSRWT